ncbi:MAG TPA: septum formation initiator family protein [Bacteroidales bacterium]
MNYFCSNHFKKMDTLRKFYAFIKPYLNKYVITVVVFVVFIIFIDDNNVIRRVQYELQIIRLRKEIRHYEKLRDENTLKLEKLHSSDSELERIAREDYMMKKPNEEVFIVE